MYLSNHTYGKLSLLLLLVFVTVFSCQDMDDDGLPITNDFRVLQTQINDDAVTSGVDGASVLSTLTLILSHPVEQSAFEGALSIEPDAAYTFAYDGNNSIVTLSFDEPLAYETTYTLTLPAGTYGNAGQASQNDYSFTFTTAAFAAPPVTLSVEPLSLFETETAVITATIPQAILRDVTMDILLSGSATEGDDYTVTSHSGRGDFRHAGANRAQRSGFRRGGTHYCGARQSDQRSTNDSAGIGNYPG